MNMICEACGHHQSHHQASYGQCMECEKLFDDVGAAALPGMMQCYCFITPVPEQPDLARSLIATPAGSKTIEEAIVDLTSRIEETTNVGTASLGLAIGYGGSGGIEIDFDALIEELGKRGITAAPDEKTADRLNRMECHTLKVERRMEENRHTDRELQGKLEEAVKRIEREINPLLHFEVVKPRPVETDVNLRFNVNYDLINGEDEEMLINPKQIDMEAMREELAKAPKWTPKAGDRAWSLATKDGPFVLINPVAASVSEEGVGPDRLVETLNPSPAAKNVIEKGREVIGEWWIVQDSIGRYRTLPTATLTDRNPDGRMVRFGRALTTKTALVLMAITIYAVSMVAFGYFVKG